MTQAQLKGRNYVPARRATFHPEPTLTGKHLKFSLHSDTEYRTKLFNEKRLPEKKAAMPTYHPY